MAPNYEPQNEEVNKQLKDLNWQGGGLATFAHWCAVLLLVAFSMGSLLSISRVAFLRFLSEAQAGRLDLPDGISLVVNLLLVLSADAALLYAASQLRVLMAAKAPAGEQVFHHIAMWGTSAIEAMTYLYLAWQYDQPRDFWLWAIVFLRAVGAPLIAAYLSMARPIPVGPRDVAYQASLASGKGLVRDVAILAADPNASLERKTRIYSAAALMSPQDRRHFDGIIEAVKPDTSSAPVLAIEPPVRTPDNKPPTGPGSPTVAPRTEPSVRTDDTRVIEMPTRQRRQSAARASTKRGKGSSVRTAAERQQQAAQTRTRRLAQLAAWLGEEPTIGTRELTRKLQLAEHSRVSESTVNSLRRQVESGGLNPSTSQYAQ